MTLERELALASARWREAQGLDHRSHFSERVATLRQAAARGDGEASWELGCLFEEGVVDARGRQLVPPALKDAFVAYRRSAALGNSSGLMALGLCYDNGAGVRQDKQRGRRCYLAVWRTERLSWAASNIATVHRDLGHIGAALRWWNKAAAAGDGGALVDIGYCYYYGLGGRPDRTRALAAFRRADTAKSITELDREEALYHRAVACLDRADARGRVMARALLLKATVEGDYPEAQDLLAQLDSGEPPVPCRCRRGMTRATPGQAPCVVHRRRAHAKAAGSN